MSARAFPWRSHVIGLPAADGNDDVVVDVEEPTDQPAVEKQVTVDDQGDLVVGDRGEERRHVGTAGHGDLVDPALAQRQALVVAKATLPLRWGDDHRAGARLLAAQIGRVVCHQLRHALQLEDGFQRRDPALHGGCPVGSENLLERIGDRPDAGAQPLVCIDHHLRAGRLQLAGGDLEIGGGNHHHR
jgi:hypothetical protein